MWRRDGINVIVFHEGPQPHVKGVDLAGRAMAEEIRAADELAAAKARLNAAAAEYNRVFARRPISATLVGYALGYRPWRVPRPGRR